METQSGWVVTVRLQLGWPSYCAVTLWAGGEVWRALSTSRNWITLSSTMKKKLILDEIVARFVLTVPSRLNTSMR